MVKFQSETVRNEGKKADGSVGVTKECVSARENMPVTTEGYTCNPMRRNTYAYCIVPHSIGEKNMRAASHNRRSNLDDWGDRSCSHQSLRVGFINIQTFLADVSHKKMQSYTN